MAHVRLEGSLKLRAVAAQIQATGDKGLGREMSTALRRVVKPVSKSIKDTLVASMPERGGYRATISKSVRFRTAIRSGSRSGTIRITTTAAGEKELRDLPRLDKGELRHPVFGRSRTVRDRESGTGRRRVPNPWAVTKVTPRFFERGTENAADHAEKELEVVLDEFAQRLAQ